MQSSEEETAVQIFEHFQRCKGFVLATTSYNTGGEAKYQQKFTFGASQEHL
jgi:hypothetical protein